jgi:hypothetical protein
MRAILSVIAVTALPALTSAQDLNDLKKFMDILKNGYPFDEVRAHLPADGTVLELHRKKDVFTDKQGDQRDEWVQIAFGKKLMARPGDRDEKKETSLGTGISAKDGYIEVQAGWRARSKAIGLEHDFDGTFTCRLNVTLSKGVWTVRVDNLKLTWHGAFLPVEGLVSDLLKLHLSKPLTDMLNAKWNGEVLKNNADAKEEASKYSATLVHDRFVLVKEPIIPLLDLGPVRHRNGPNKLTVEAKLYDKMKVKIVDNQSELDASAAKVLSSIEVIEKIDGQSVVRFNTGRRGSVIIKGQINGKSTVYIHAPEGHVEFHEEINGQSHLHITAKTVVFHKKIDGGWIDNRRRITEVHLTLSSGGSVSAPELCGHMYWRRADPKGEAPRVSIGIIHWDGKLEEWK